MKSFDIAVMDNVNVSRLIEILNGLQALGCSIQTVNGNFRVEYEDQLEEDVKVFFDMDYKNNF